MNKVLVDYYEARKVHDEALEDLETQTQRIVNLLKKIFKCPKDTWWSFKYYESGDDDPPLPDEIDKNAKYGDSFPIHISAECAAGNWEYSGAIPVKFFDMTDEEITFRIKNEIREDELEEIKRKEAERKKQETRNIRKNALKASAAEKLTKEERKALGI
jgi:hypothetical protein